MLKRVFWLALLLLATACAPTVWRAPGWEFEVMGVKGVVRLVPAKDFGFCKPHMIGCAAPVGHSCLVMLDKDKWDSRSDKYRTLLLAHEIAHCLDGSVLEYSHNGFKDEGKVYGQYWAAPAEGFAEAFAQAYYAACGANMAPLGYGEGPACEIPDPRSIDPKNLTPRQ